jgi:hypothetical protein
LKSFAAACVCKKLAQHIAGKHTQSISIIMNTIITDTAEKSRTHISAANIIVDDFLRHNAIQSALFISPDQRFQRQQYRAKYPTEVAVTKCMDGRLNFAVMTETPFGIVRPFRNLGGQFNIGGHFGELLEDWVQHAVKKGRDCIIFVTYHWSKGSEHRGCKGFNYDCVGAQTYTKKLLGNIETVFGKKHLVVYPIQVGIETDEDALILHGSNGSILDLSKVEIDAETGEPKGMRAALETLFPDMKPSMVESFLPYCLGNVRHIAKIRKMKRPLADIDHQEKILAVGRGFDWHHIPNKMLIVNPDYDLAKSIATAGNVLLENLQKGRIPKEQGVALIASAVYNDEAGSQRERVIFKASWLANFALETLQREVPDIIPYLKIIAAGILNQNTRLFTPIPLSDPKNN